MMVVIDRREKRILILACTYGLGELLNIYAAPHRDKFKPLPNTAQTNFPQLSMIKPNERSPHQAAAESANSLRAIQGGSG